MPDQLQLRGGTTAQHTSFTGASKEVTVDTTKKTAVVHDGSTVGGVPLLREDGSNSALTLGSAGTPSIKFTGDPNTGIFSPGADQVAISTNGTGRLFVDATGNVGVGTASPAYQLVVGQNAWIGTGGGASTGVGTPRTLTIAVNRTATDVSPSFQLLKGFTSATATLGGFKIDLANANVGSPELAFYSGTSTGNTNASFVEPTWTEAARIDSSGRLLVGTSSATGANLLQVNSDARINGITVGRGSAASNNDNTAIGSDALQANTSSGDQNTAVGYRALYANTDGLYNVAVGYQALKANTTGSTNTAIGRNALPANISGTNNTAVGIGTLTLNTIGARNVAIGTSALEDTTGDNNTAMGVQALQANTTGTNNTCIGYLSAGASTTTSNAVTLGNSSIATLRCAVTTITAISDARDKTNIINLPAGLDFINALRPVAFDWNTRDGAKVGIREFGFIAQELQEAQASTGITVPNLVSTENPDKLEASPGVLLPILINAVKQLSAQNAALEARLAALETA